MTDVYICQVTHKSPLLGEVGSSVAWSEDREQLLLTRSVELCRVWSKSRFDRTDIINIPHNVFVLREHLCSFQRHVLSECFHSGRVSGQSQLAQCFRNISHQGFEPSTLVNIYL